MTCTPKPQNVGDARNLEPAARLRHRARERGDRQHPARIEFFAAAAGGHAARRLLGRPRTARYSEHRQRLVSAGQATSPA